MLSVWDEGPDLLGVFVGSEGTLGIATKLTLRILRAPEAVRTLLAGFGHTDEAGGAVSEVIARGIVPAAIEMMDAVTMEAAEAAVQANYPAGCGAVLIVPARRPLRAASPSLRHDARPRDRRQRHGDLARRDAGELGRHRTPPAPAAGGGSHGRDGGQLAVAAPLAARAERGRRVAYVEQVREPAWSPLAERVQEVLCRPS